MSMFVHCPHSSSERSLKDLVLLDPCFKSFYVFHNLASELNKCRFISSFLLKVTVALSYKLHNTDKNGLKQRPMEKLSKVQQTRVAVVVLTSMKVAMLFVILSFHLHSNNMPDSTLILYWPFSLDWFLADYKFRSTKVFAHPYLYHFLYYK